MKDGSLETLAQAAAQVKALIPRSYASPAMCCAVQQLELAEQRWASLLVEQVDAHRKAWAGYLSDMAAHAGQLATSAAVRNYLVTRQAQPHPKRQARARGGELAAMRAQQRAMARNAGVRA